MKNLINNIIVFSKNIKKDFANNKKNRKEKTMNSNSSSLSNGGNENV